LQMVKPSATRWSCIAILWINLVSFAATTLCVASQQVFIVVSVYFVIDSVRKLLDTSSYTEIVLSTAELAEFPLQKHESRFSLLPPAEYNEGKAVPVLN
jgi:hypothetical protein